MIFRETPKSKNPPINAGMAQKEKKSLVRRKPDLRLCSEDNVANGDKNKTQKYMVEEGKKQAKELEKTYESSPSEKKKSFRKAQMESALSVLSGPDEKKKKKKPAKKKDLYPGRKKRPKAIYKMGKKLTPAEVESDMKKQKTKNGSLVKTIEKGIGTMREKYR